SLTTFSAGAFSLMDFCLIFVPFGQYDEPEILRYAITSMCPKGADVRQNSHQQAPSGVTTSASPKSGPSNSRPTAAAASGNWIGGNSRQSAKSSG
ncbi:MAG: hypothetical protein QF578_18820, partial [Alphaproteobacteria bacterium]|nr:hypothetical protein [Alphaproteobacteria bacterium]